MVLIQGKDASAGLFPGQELRKEPSVPATRMGDRMPMAVACSRLQDGFQLLVCSFSKDGTHIAAGSNDCHVYMWHWPAGGGASGAGSSSAGGPEGQEPFSAEKAQPPAAAAAAGGAAEAAVGVGSPRAATGVEVAAAGGSGVVGGSSSPGTAAGMGEDARLELGTAHWPMPQVCGVLR